MIKDFFSIYVDYETILKLINYQCFSSKCKIGHFQMYADLYLNIANIHISTAIF